MAIDVVNTNFNLEWPLKLRSIKLPWRQNKNQTIEMLVDLKCEGHNCNSKALKINKFYNTVET